LHCLIIDKFSNHYTYIDGRMEEKRKKIEIFCQQLTIFDIYNEHQWNAHQKEKYYFIIIETSTITKQIYTNY
jgi:hypothetical protein